MQHVKRQYCQMRRESAYVTTCGFGSPFWRVVVCLSWYQVWSCPGLSVNFYKRKKAHVIISWAQNPYFNFGRTQVSQVNQWQRELPGVHGAKLPQINSQCLIPHPENTAARILCFSVLELELEARDHVILPSLRLCPTLDHPHPPGYYNLSDELLPHSAYRANSLLI